MVACWSRTARMAWRRLSTGETLNLPKPRPLLASSYNSATPSCVSISLTLGIGWTSCLTLSFSSFRSTQILTPWPLCHHGQGVGVVIFGITPRTPCSWVPAEFSLVVGMVLSSACRGHAVSCPPIQLHSVLSSHHSESFEKVWKLLVDPLFSSGCIMVSKRW